MNKQNADDVVIQWKKLINCAADHTSIDAAHRLPQMFTDNTKAK